MGNGEWGTGNGGRRRKIVCLGFLICGVMMAASASAQKTTSANIRAATTFASQVLGICSGTPQNDADCYRKVFRCNDADWAEYVEENVEFSGSTVARKNDPRLPDEVVAYLNKDDQNRRRIPQLRVATCFCECKEGDLNAPCIGAAGPVNVAGGDLLTREECEAACSPRATWKKKCAGALDPVEYDYGESPVAAPEETTKAAALQLRCFTKEECLKQHGVWEAFAECREGKGRCYAESSAIALNVPIGSVTQVGGFDEYIVAAYRYLLSVLVVVTTVMFIYGAFRYLVGASLGSVSRGKEIMIDAVIGMALVLGATTILRTINPALTNLNPLKVYMINTVQNISAVYCSDLSSEMKLADAGETQKIRSREEVEKAENPYTVSSKKAACGRSYYIEGSTGGACEGSACENAGDACVSCINAEFSECGSTAGAYKVCARVEFSGNINYGDERYPEDIALVFACAAAKNPSNIEIIRNNLDQADMQEARIVRGAGLASSDASKAGTASYHIDLDENDIREARSACAAYGSGNRLLGAFLVVEYNGGTAVLARTKCMGGGGRLSGYASDVGSMSDAAAMAFQCAITPPNTDFENPAAAYWTADELLLAAGGGNALTCNFNLDAASAPEAPISSAYCMNSNATPEPGEPSTIQNILLPSQSGGFGRTY